MSVDARMSAEDYRQIMSFMREQTEIMSCQKRLIHNQQVVIESQRLHLEVQDKKIQQLVKECDLIKESSTQIAEKIVNTQISIYLKRSETNDNELQKKIRALKVESDAMKCVAMSATIIVAGCISYPLIPVAIVGCTIMANR